MNNQNPLQRIHVLKVTIVAIVSLAVGIGLLTLSKVLEARSDWAWLSFWPLGEVGGILVGAGLFGIIWEFFDGRDRERRDDLRLQRVLQRATPDFTDAVVKGFATKPEDLERVATPGLLDDLATNALGLRLGDADFAREIYADLVSNVIRSPERWHDADVRIRLSSMDERSTKGAPLFGVTVTWEYSVVPSHPIQRFTCTSDRDEFHELLNDMPATATWFMTPRTGFDASSREAFELLQFSIDGEERKIRRSSKKSGQTYSVAVGDDIVRDKRMVRIRHVYRTITAKSTHKLYLAIAQPTKGLSMTMDYTDTDIAHMSATDLISSAQRTRLARLPDETAREVSVQVPGWVLPKAEVNFVWSLESEVHPSRARRKSSSRVA